MTDTNLQQLIINVGTKAQIEAAIAGGTITEDMLSVATDSPEYATQTWVGQQGFITSASLPTKLSDLTDDTATTPIARATADASGNTITTTYATKTELSNKVDLNLNNMNPSATAKETIVGWGCPDYSAGVSTTISTSTTYTAPSAGFVVMDANNSATQNGLVINNVSVQNGNKLYCDGQYIVSKGDILKCANSTINIHFYPFKGV